MAKNREPKEFKIEAKTLEIKEFKSYQQVRKGDLIIYSRDLMNDESGNLNPPHHFNLPTGRRLKTLFHTLSLRYKRYHTIGSGEQKEDGTYSVSQVLCHSFEQGHMWVLISWEGFIKPTWEMAYYMPSTLLNQYLNDSPVPLEIYDRFREEQNILLHEKDEVTTEEENDEEEEEEEEDEEDEEKEETVVKLKKSIYGKNLVD